MRATSTFVIGSPTMRECREIGQRFDVVVNQGIFRIDDEVADAYSEMARDLEQRHYRRVSCYPASTCALMHMKLGTMLTRSVVPQDFESDGGAQNRRRASTKRSRGGRGLRLVHG